MVEYYENFKMAFAKILDFLRRLGNRSKAPQGISNDCKSQNSGGKTELRSK